MQTSRWLFGFVAVAILTLSTGTAVVAQNADPLFCLCIPILSDAALTASETVCEDETVDIGYSRHRLRPPKFGEVVNLLFIPDPIPTDVELCTEWISGTLGCRNALFEPRGPLAPHLCLGSPAMF